MAEYEEAVGFYEDRVPGLGRDFFGDVEHLLERISEHPEIGSRVDSVYRRTFCRRFPFCVIYREDGDDLLVLAVMHQRRRPGYWKERA